MPSQEQRQFTELTGWLARKRESQRAFSRRIDVDDSVLSKLITGKLKRWNPVLVNKISIGTGGAVGINQFMEFAKRLQPKPKRRAA